MAGEWGKCYGKLCGWVEENIEETLSFYRLPRQHHKNMRSTNMLERLVEEIKRRTLIVRIFPNAAACLRLVRALAVEIDENWIEAMQYLNMEPLAEQKKKLSETSVMRPEIQRTTMKARLPFCFLQKLTSTTWSESNSLGGAIRSARDVMGRAMMRRSNHCTAVRESTGLVRARRILIAARKLAHKLGQKTRAFRAGVVSDRERPVPGKDD